MGLIKTTSYFVCKIVFLLCFIDKVFGEYPYNANFEDQMREKCMTRTRLSFFYRDMMRCTSRRASPGMGCHQEDTTIGYTEELDERFSGEEKRLTYMSGAAKESEMFNTLIFTCVLTAGGCERNLNFTQVSYKCYTLDRTPRTYADAWNSCVSKNTSIVVLSQDKDASDVLKYISSTNPDISAVWTGLHNNGAGAGWEFPPGFGNADYARWMPGSTFYDFPLGTIVHTRSYDPRFGSYAGYMSARNQYEKFPTLCVKGIGTNFANDAIVTYPFVPVLTTTRSTTRRATTRPVTTTTKAPVITTTKKPVITTTKKPATTTTRAPVTTTNPPATTTTSQTLTLEELVSQNILGRPGFTNLLYRSYNPSLIFHQYQRDFNLHCSNSNTKERFVGFVVTPLMPGVLARCPNLIPMNMYQNRGAQAWTLFNGTSTNSNLDFVATIYCARSKGYCGANFEMVEYLSTVGAGDKFIPSFTAEVQGTSNNNFYQNQPNRRLCWIWRDAPSNISPQFNTARNRVLNAGNPIMRTYINTNAGAQNSYSVNRADHNNLVGQGRKAKPDIGFIVTNQMWQDTFRQSCPELIPVGVHRRSGSVTTYFGNNPPYTADRIGGFYCAPRRGYCGADYLLRQRPTMTLGLDNYVVDNYEDYENVKCTAKARYSDKDEAVCWIWKDPSTYKI